MSALRHTTSSSDFADYRTLLSYLQAKVERDKVELSRVLHDDLGGLLVAAHMDATWVEQHLTSTVDEKTRARLQRARSTLASAIDLKRKLIEELYPTLLGNVGLFAALTWHFKHGCEHAHLRCTANIPTQELALTADASIALFRIVEEALAFITARKATLVDLDVRVDFRRLVIRLSHDCRAISDHDAAAHFVDFASMRHRVWHLHGTVDTRAKAGRSVITLTVPLTAIVPAAVIPLAPGSGGAPPVKSI